MKNRVLSLNACLDFNKGSAQDGLYAKQFSQVYYARLSELREPLGQVAMKKWHTFDHMTRLLELKSETPCYIVGTLYVDLPSKPNVLQDLTPDLHIQKQAVGIKYVDNGIAKYYLEDESARIQCDFSSVDKTFLITGITLALLGQEDPTGVFKVKEVCSFDLVPPALPTQYGKKRGKLALVSGDIFNSADGTFGLACDYLKGLLDDSCIDIRGLVISGNAVGKPTKIVDPSNKTKLGQDGCRYDLQKLHWLDQMFYHLGKSIAIDLMAGEHDPTNISLPQAPMPCHLFPNASTLNSFRTVSNPYWVEMDGVSILGTSGQNIEDFYKSVEANDRLAIMEKTLLYRHVAPSAPDTLWCFPFAQRDPFILAKTPHVYFAGNQPKFDHRVLTGPNGARTLIVMVPDFSIEPVVVLIDLDELTCTSIFIKTRN